jgi:hypothetical protein
MLKVNRLALLQLIEKTGEEILLCSAYIKARKPELCKVLLEKSKQYREYIQRGFAYYNVSSVPTKNLDKLIREDERLNIERELALS